MIKIRFKYRNLIERIQVEYSFNIEICSNDLLCRNNNKHINAQVSFASCVERRLYQKQPRKCFVLQKKNKLFRTIVFILIIAIDAYINN